MGKLWYISPSNQKDNLGLGSYGRETDQMYRLAEDITPMLEQHDVQFHVAGRELTLAQRSEEANRMGAGWYLALHSNAGGGGTAFGPVAFYAVQGRSLAEELARNLLETGQKNNRSANVQQSSSLYELIHPNAPACLLEVDFHDSETGVRFLTERRADAAQAIAKAIVTQDGKLWQSGTGDNPAPWAKDATEKAKLLGLFQGDGQGNYDWQKNLTREEAAVLLLRLKELMES